MCWPGPSSVLSRKSQDLSSTLHFLPAKVTQYIHLPEVLLRLAFTSCGRRSTFRMAGKAETKVGWSQRIGFGTIISIMDAAALLLSERVANNIQLGESHIREFKSAYEGLPDAKKPRSVKDICREVGEQLVGFANADGGDLLIGV